MQDTQTRKFNEMAAKFGEDVMVYTVSMDLPFAQTRWCGAAGIDKIQTVSDHKDASFGKNYGVLIQELRLLARAIFVVNQEGKVTYVCSLCGKEKTEVLEKLPVSGSGTHTGGVDTGDNFPAARLAVALVGGAALTAALMRYKKKYPAR